MPAHTTAQNDSYSVGATQTLTVPVATGVLANDTDPEGAALSAVLVQGPAHGTVTLNVTKHGEDGIACETTNGMISLTLPPSVNARLSARVTNGAISQEGFNLTVSEQSRRRLDATIGGGGPPIRLETTNGAIQVRASK